MIQLTLFQPPGPVDYYGPSDRYCFVILGLNLGMIVALFIFPNYVKQRLPKPLKSLAYLVYVLGFGVIVSLFLALWFLVRLKFF